MSVMTCLMAPGPVDAATALASTNKQKMRRQTPSILEADINSLRDQYSAYVYIYDFDAMSIVFLSSAPLTP